MTTISDTLVKYSETDAVGSLVLNDPENLNAMSEQMAEQFRATVAEIIKRKKLPRAIVLSGAGRAFSAGGSLEMLQEKSKIPPEENRKRMLYFYDCFLSILNIPVPLIAALNGPAIGAGLCLASACDIRICGSNAKLGFTFTKLGLHPGMGATYFLPRIIGESAARHLLLTAKIIDAAQALRLGLVSEVVESNKLDECSKKIVEEIFACGPESVSLLVQSLRRPYQSLHETLEHEALCQSYSYAGKEFTEGIRAALEKRPAKFI